MLAIQALAVMCLVCRAHTATGVEFQTKLLEIDGQQTVLQLWDTAGQERYVGNVLTRILVLIVGATHRQKKRKERKGQAIPTCSHTLSSSRVLFCQRLKAMVSLVPYAPNSGLFVCARIWMSVELQQFL